jgi:[protein-PII] uridylyltransferase
MATLTRSRRRRGRRGPHVVLDEAPARLVRQRRDAALSLVDVTTTAARARVDSAPPGYVLSHDAADIARHCALIDPCPAAEEIRVVATPGPVGWQVDVAARDRPGLLAAVTGALAAHDLDVRQAVIATWDDGAALDAFVVATPFTPDVDALQHDVTAALPGPHVAGRVPRADVTFRDDVSRWYTRCEVRVADQPGLFHALAVALAAAGADVHAARATTANGHVLDVFDLTDAAGHKLTGATKEAIVALLAAGAAGDPVARDPTGRARPPS